jgi:hypothetical protein
MSENGDAGRIDQLLDAIELLKANRRPEARDVLRRLIHEHNEFEDAWLWMSVAVDSLDESAVCLDNVLRVNPRNVEAASALARIRAPELKVQQERNRLRFYRDITQTVLWLLMLAVMFGAFFTFTSFAAIAGG